jgi:hypothetical protein
MNMTLITWGATILGGIGIWLFLSKFFDFLIDLCNGLINYIKRFWEPAAIKWLKEGIDTEKADQNLTKSAVALRLSESLIFWLVLAVCLAFLTFDKLLAVVVFSIVFVSGEVYIATARSHRLSRLNTDVENLIIQFESRYPLKRSISGTLDDAATQIAKGELRTALDLSRSLLRLNRTTADAMKPLMKLRNPTVRQFATTISDAQETSPEALQQNLAHLKRDVDSRSKLFGDIRQSLTVLRVTSRILQVILAGTSLIATCLGGWRSYFLASNANWMMLVIMMVMGVASSFYVEIEIQQLEEA